MRIDQAVSLAAVALATLAPGRSSGSPGHDEKAVAALDTEYQAAVERNDAATMDRILADDFVLVVGSGKVFTKADLLKEAREKTIAYERQKEIEGSQKVRVWGDAAVVTAKLRLKGSEGGRPFERRLSFSDTYVRTKSVWRCVFGQASLALPGCSARSIRWKASVGSMTDRRPSPRSTPRFTSLNPWPARAPWARFGKPFTIPSARRRRPSRHWFTC